MYCGECTAGGYRVGLGLIKKAKSWYNGVVYRVSNILDSLVSYHFSHLIGRADSLFIGADHSGREGERGGCGVSSLAGREGGKRDQSQGSYEDQKQHLVILLCLAVLELWKTGISWKLLV